mgnify:CR=1 FL=1
MHTFSFFVYIKLSIMPATVLISYGCYMKTFEYTLRINYICLSEHLFSIRSSILLNMHWAILVQYIFVIVIANWMFHLQENLNEL